MSFLVLSTQIPETALDRTWGHHEAEARVVLTTARYVEDCEYSEHAMTSCMPQPPTCKRR